MARTVGIVHQDFEQLIKNDFFYVDKTLFIKEWWESGDVVTLLTRPRRFGKTLTLDMAEKFFSVKYEGRRDLFEGLAIWREEKYRGIQGTYPVIFVSFAGVKEITFLSARKKICQIITNLYNKYDFLLDSDCLNENEKAMYKGVSADMEDYMASDSLKNLSDYLMRYFGRKVIILLDEYDSPMQEAYINGYWDESAAFIRNLFNSTFKTNPYLECAVMTGITRISKESVFSDLNNLEVVTVTSEKYQDCFGFTQQEVSDALKEYGISDREKEVRDWYDGFIFGTRRDIYNPWSIINYLDKKTLSAYWANTSSNSLVGKLIREGNRNVKMVMEDLLKGDMFHAYLDEQIVFSQLDVRESAVWSLLLASGYLRVECFFPNERRGKHGYGLVLTNWEVRMMFEQMVEDWFAEYVPEYNDFIKALLQGDIKGMNAYMNEVALETISYFDTGRKPSETAEPERFYHGFVLGLIVDLADRYTVTSNRESGYGRYDVMLEPRHKEDDAIILEFKVFDAKEERTLKDTVESALAQIEDKQYEAAFKEKGIPQKRIRKYGFAFEGKQVLIGS